MMTLKSSTTTTKHNWTIISHLATLCTLLVLYLHFYQDWTLDETGLSRNIKMDKFLKTYPAESSQGANPFDPLTTEQRLRKHYPYDQKTNTKTRIPKKIWQMWRFSPTEKNFPYADLHDKWTKLNPNFKYNFQTNAELIDLICEKFKYTVPEVAYALESLPSLILKADFSRYLVLFLYGGAYSDLDVNLLVPMDDWFDTNRDVGLVIGMENDGTGDNPTPLLDQIENWFFKAKPRHPVLAKLIATVVKNTFEAHDKGLVPDDKDHQDSERCSRFNVLSWTGPFVLSHVVHAHINSLQNPTIVDTRVERSRYCIERVNKHAPEIPRGAGFNLHTVKCLAGPLVVNDIVIYPMYVLRGYDDSKECYINHLYHGSWKAA
ncbi:unnamed protein product [Ambrosiozyma monospora]|uniref:Unnamed protein product n=1 Tax=Ambrosiozyma monospora TaxID=43982 RepID=A0ACB5TP84_AMBMO|nr:unnamed protein product [Ambrosiozyma monospora]